MPRRTTTPYRFSVSTALDLEHYNKLIKFCEQADITPSSALRPWVIAKIDSITLMDEDHD